MVFPFGCVELKSNNTNIEELWNELSDVDKKLFPFDMKIVRWSAYLQHHVHGIARHIIKLNNAN